MKPYYEQDGIVIYHGDCREVLPTLEPVDLVLTDPPYGLGEILGRTPSNNTQWSKHFGTGAPSWDKQTVDEGVSLAVMLGKWSIVWGGQFYLLGKSRCQLVWNKIVRNWSSSEAELAWTNLDKPNRCFDYSHGQLASEGKHFHPTQKPLPLMKWCINQAPSDCQIILDPFMGSGTTLRAAKDLGRRAIGIEIEERYCEIAANRLRQGVLFGSSESA